MPRLKIARIHTSCILLACLVLIIDSMKVIDKVIKRTVKSVSISKQSIEPTVSYKGIATIKPKFFHDASEFRSWLVENHETEKELWMGFYKKNSGKTSVTYDEAVDQMLCFGWIDGICKSMGEESYAQRITPRNVKKSNWSAININKMKVLTEAGLVTPAGRLAYERWKEKV